MNLNHKAGESVESRIARLESIQEKFEKLVYGWQQVNATRLTALEKKVYGLPDDVELSNPPVPPSECVETPVGYCPKGYVDICPQVQTCQGCEGYKAPSDEPTISISRKVADRYLKESESGDLFDCEYFINELRRAIGKGKV
jgi:hypothetical protein